MVEFANSNYDGSRIFITISESSGLSIDIVNFLISQLLGVVLGSFLRVCLPPHRVATAVRHIFCAVIGLALLYFCYGNHSIHVVLLPIICYLITTLVPPTSAHKFIMVTALGYLSFIHLRRQTYNYGSSVLDITGPMMVITQKVTSLAFCISDGFARDPLILTAEQRQLATRKMPTFLEYFGYMFYFPALMCGPILLFTHYKYFIEETSRMPSPISINRSYADLDKLTISEKPSKKDHDGSGDVINCAYKLPSPIWPIAKKLLASLVCAILLLKLQPFFSIRTVAELEFIQSVSIWKLFLYVTAATTVVRLKYYHAWLIADAVCTSCGLGFGGFSENGSAQWKGLTNVDILGFEGAKSLHDCLVSWNKSTVQWLRHTVNSRVTSYKLILTYVVSAIWHGFYPGYYITFFTGALFTSAGRNIRRLIRPKFQTSRKMAAFYDVITFVVTKLSLGYLTFPFILLEFWPSIAVYKRMYFSFHILSLMAIFVLPVVVKPTVENKKRPNGHLLSNNGTNGWISKESNSKKNS